MKVSLLCYDPLASLRRTGLNLSQGRFRLDIERVVKHWRKLPRKMAESPFLEVHEGMWICHLGIWCKGGLGLMVGLYDPEGLFQP